MSRPHSHHTQVTHGFPGAFSISLPSGDVALPRSAPTGSPRIILSPQAKIGKATSANVPPADSTTPSDFGEWRERFSTLSAYEPGLGVDDGSEDEIVLQLGSPAKDSAPFASVVDDRSPELRALDDECTAGGVDAMDDELDFILDFLSPKDVERLMGGTNRSVTSDTETASIIDL